MKNWSYQLYRTLWTSLDLLFPPVCGGCGKPGTHWCVACRKKTHVLDGILCDVCGLPQEQVGVCNTCLSERPKFRSLRAWAVFDDPVQAALHQLKYCRNISLGITFAREMLPFVKQLNWPVDILIPVPLGRGRLKERGYNQVGMIARPLAMAMNLNYAPNGLVRRKETRSQVGLTRGERRENVRDAFVAGIQVKGREVLVVDDVSTTGSTLSSGAEVLLSAGASEVYALTVARALPRHGLSRA